MSNSDRLSISGPVEIASTSKGAVAFNLMQHIASYETNDQKPKDRKYWPTLYWQCWKVSSGYGLESVLKEE